MNDNVFRSQYRELTYLEKEDMDTLKAKAQDLWCIIDRYQGREASIAKTKLEEAVMWAVKGITA